MVFANLAYNSSNLAQIKQQARSMGGNGNQPPGSTGPPGGPPGGGGPMPPGGPKVDQSR